MEIKSKDPQLKKLTEEAVVKWKNALYRNLPEQKKEIDEIFDEKKVMVKYGNYIEDPKDPNFGKSFLLHFRKKTGKKYFRGLANELSDTNYIIYIGSGCQPKELELVILHEIGHVLGLYHPDQRCKVNYKCIMARKWENHSKRITKYNILALKAKHQYKLYV